MNTPDINTLRGVFAEGYTSEDATRVLNAFEEHTGLALAICWEGIDNFSTYGDSDFVMITARGLQVAPRGVFDFLVDGEDLHIEITSFDLVEAHKFDERNYYLRDLR